MAAANVQQMPALMATTFGQCGQCQQHYRGQEENHHGSIVRLPCYRKVCSDCFENWPSLLLIAGKCIHPKCKRQHESKSGKYIKPSIDLRLAAIKRFLAFTRDPHHQPLQCDSCGNNAITSQELGYCCSCSILCQNCIREHKRMSRCFRKPRHTIYKMADVQNRKSDMVSFCQLHGHVLDNFCEDCKAMSCVKCTEKECQGHNLKHNLRLVLASKNPEIRLEQLCTEITECERHLHQDLARTDHLDAQRVNAALSDASHYKEEVLKLLNHGTDAEILNEYNRLDIKITSLIQNAFDD